MVVPGRVQRGLPVRLALSVRRDRALPRRFVGGERLGVVFFGLTRQAMDTARRRRRHGSHRRRLGVVQRPGVPDGQVRRCLELVEFNERIGLETVNQEVLEATNLLGKVFVVQLDIG